MSASAEYARQLVPFASGWFLTVTCLGATATEAYLGLMLLAGWRPKLVGNKLPGARSIWNRDGCIARYGIIA